MIKLIRTIQAERELSKENAKKIILRELISEVGSKIELSELASIKLVIDNFEGREMFILSKSKYEIEKLIDEMICDGIIRIRFEFISGPPVGTVSRLVVERIK